ncbi:MAG: RibD family protein [Planctomycetes bacterium]|nr:RibD family protein [Planctomycetota bacterium]
MVCELGDDSAWPAFLEARSVLAQGTREFVFVRRGAQWSCLPTGTADLRPAQQVFALSHAPVSALAADAALTVFDPADAMVPTFVHPTRRPVDASFLAMARVYLPVLLGAAAARRRGRTFVAAHVTQTLDGRIACPNGQSQWIGNAADLRHAHRMRALLDGVLVGAGTVRTDDPRLDVRHVTGPNPRRIVLSGSGAILRERHDRHAFRGAGCDVVVAAGNGAPAPGRSHVLEVPATADALDPVAVLAALRSRDVHSIYLEGGSQTLSSFLQARCIDLLQVHIAAMVLGAGIPSFTLTPVEHVRHGLQFTMDHTMLDGHVLLSCWPSVGEAG